MKTLFSVWLFFVVICAGFPARAETKEVYDVSIIQLIAAPKLYAKKTVQVVGFLNIEFEGDGIYFHEEDFRRGLINNGLGIWAEGEVRERLKKLSGQYVIIEGVVDASYSDAVAVAGFRTSIRNITRADPWKVGRTPSSPP
jgi:hypothetical protein